MLSKSFVWIKSSIYTIGYTTVISHFVDEDPGLERLINFIKITEILSSGIKIQTEVVQLHSWLTIFLTIKPKWWLSLREN